MSKKLAVLFLTLAILIMLSSVYVVSRTLAYIRYQQESLAAQAYCGGQATVRICVAADSANVHTDTIYRQHAKAHTLIDTILVSDARNAHIAPML